MPYRVWLSVMVVAAVMLGVGVKFIDGQTGCDGLYDRYAHPTGLLHKDPPSEAAYRRHETRSGSPLKLISLAR